MYYTTAPVRGASFRGDVVRAVLEQEVKVGDIVVLSREPENPYDENAIMVHWQDHHIGYIGKEFAAKLAPYMDEGRVFRSAIFGFNNPLSPVVEIEEVATDAAA